MGGGNGKVCAVLALFRALNFTCPSLLGNLYQRYAGLTLKEHSDLKGGAFILLEFACFYSFIVFPPVTRVVPIAERYGLDSNAALDNIIVARALTSEHQSELLTQIGAKMIEEQYRLLVCIDS